MGDRPTIEDDDDELEIERDSQPFETDSEAPLDKAIVEAVHTMGAVGAEAEEEYQRTLDGLYRNKEEVVARVAELYDQLPEERYIERWSLIQLLVELEDKRALDFLDEVISSEIPEEKSEGTHHFTTVGEEIMIRTTAIGAVTRVAPKSDRAVKILEKHARDNNRSIQVAAIQGYLELGDQAETTLQRLLPEKDHSLLDIRKADVEDVPQAQGHLDLAPEETDAVPPPDYDEETRDEDEHSH